MWGGQLENSTYATSYIPTLATSVTRLPDGAIKTGISSLFGATEGVVYLQVGRVRHSGVTGATKWFIEVRKDDNNSFGIGAGNTDVAPNIRFVTNINGVVTTEAEPNGFNNAKIAIKYTSTQFKLFVNGILTNTINKSIGNYSAVQFMEGAGQDLLMDLKNFKIFSTALTDAECVQLTK
jgi:hypothetical protein